ncbi:MAG: heat-inducible transcriptional repressor HrcA [Dissulfurimicrobium sp.]|uniref:heat-inducible transcriptional repressor HrcA n=1 Tax=Dissulfurimicrobium sp. TaxID=2022436 RepID=UPI0040491DBC
MSRPNYIKNDVSDRGKDLLKAIINAYINNAEPIGSKTISKKYNFGLSPATIRNIMADLEERGLLTQPHTSAGRMPTEAGIRYYIDHLLEKETLSLEDQIAIEEELSNTYDDLSTILSKTAQILAVFSGHAAIVSTPRPDRNLLKHIKLIQIRPGIILVVSISDSGFIQNRLIKVENDLSQEHIERLSEYLNNILDHYKDLKEARDTIAKELQEEKHIVNILINDLIDRYNPSDNYGDFFIWGKENLFDQPEFSQINRLKAILNALEEKKNLIILLDRCLESNDVQIFIGSEGFGDKGPSCGIVLSSYSDTAQPLGALGIIGPMRMNYARIIPLVEYIAKVLSEKFKEL